jgi:Recombinase
MTDSHRFPDWALTPLQLKNRKDWAGRKKKSKTTRRAINWRVQQPFGVLEGESPILEMILRMHADGDSSFTIAAYLNDHKYPARTRAWYETSIKRIIERESKRYSVENGGLRREPISKPRE